MSGAVRGRWRVWNEWSSERKEGGLWKEWSSEGKDGDCGMSGAVRGRMEIVE